MRNLGKKLFIKITKLFSDELQPDEHLGFLYDNYLTIFEAIFIAYSNNVQYCNDDENTKNRNFITNFRRYENAIKKGLDDGKLHIVEGIDKAIDLTVFNRIKKKFELSYKIATDINISIPDNLIEFYKMDTDLMQKLLSSDEVYDYLIRNDLIILPDGVTSKQYILWKNDVSAESKDESQELAAKLGQFEAPRIKLQPEDASESLHSPETKKQGQAGTEAQSNERDRSVDSTGDVTVPTLINKEALKKQFRSETGSNKGKAKDKVVEAITIKAIEELGPNNECKCQHSELAEYIMELKADDCLPLFTLPGIKPGRWLIYFREATSAAFAKKGIPTRNKKKDQPRGRRFCPRHPLDPPHK